jgi:hypothetical protein
MLAVAHGATASILLRGLWITLFSVIIPGLFREQI